jgi:hypothetical protein
MASGYSRVVPFSIICGTPACVELPAPPRGVLERLIITQKSGDSEDAVINVYDRKGACIAANDLNVTESGQIASILEFGITGGRIGIVFSNEHHLIVGDQIEIKNSDIPQYNTIQQVTEVYSATEVVANATYYGDGTGGLWQTLPFNPTNKPITHLVLTANVTEGVDLVLFDIHRAYENKDNQSETMRCRHSSLWLEFLTVGAVEPSEWEVAYTCRADTVI